MNILFAKAKCRKCGWLWEFGFIGKEPLTTNCPNCYSMELDFEISNPSDTNAYVPPINMPEVKIDLRQQGGISK